MRGGWCAIRSPGAAGAASIIYHNRPIFAMPPGKLWPGRLGTSGCTGLRWVAQWGTLGAVFSAICRVSPKPASGHIHLAAIPSPRVLGHTFPSFQLKKKKIKKNLKKEKTRQSAIRTNHKIVEPYRTHETAKREKRDIDRRAICDQSAFDEKAAPENFPESRFSMP